jgi:hypothetical protein
MMTFRDDGAGTYACTDGYGGDCCEAPPDLWEWSEVVPRHVDCGSHGECETAALSARNSGPGNAVKTRTPASEVPRHVECGAHGRCEKARCLCVDGYSGPRCQTVDHCVDTPVVDDCGRHGECDDGSCICAQFWSGDRCEDANACEVPRRVEYGSHGECDDGSCVCKTGFSDTPCEKLGCIAEAATNHDPMATNCRRRQLRH